MGAALENAHEVEPLTRVLEAYASFLCLGFAQLVRQFLAGHVRLGQELSRVLIDHLSQGHVFLDELRL